MTARCEDAAERAIVTLAPHPLRHIGHIVCSCGHAAVVPVRVHHLPAWLNWFWRAARRAATRPAPLPNDRRLP